MVRSVFRAIEYLQGFDGYLLSHEAYLYGFDAVLMFLVMVLFNYIHPSEVADLLVREDREWYVKLALFYPFATVSEAAELLSFNASDSALTPELTPTQPRSA
jgi:hypothetical protein